VTDFDNMARGQRRQMHSKLFSSKHPIGGTRKTGVERNLITD